MLRVHWFLQVRLYCWRHYVISIQQLSLLIIQNRINGYDSSHGSNYLAVHFNDSIILSLRNCNNKNSIGNSWYRICGSQIPSTATWLISLAIYIQPFLLFQQVFRRGYNFIDHTRFIFPTIVRMSESYNISRKFLNSGDTQIRTLVCTPHLYFGQSASRILCDVTACISGSDFVQVVFKLEHNLFHATYFLPVTTMTVAEQRAKAVLLMFLFYIYHYRLSMIHALV